ncbi:MAG: virulence RhuM family protein [Bacteroidales bacterium]|nr:virulence RhuM family protein [Bacteroidales bacterium]
MSSNTPNTGEILLYQTADGLAKIEVTLVNETVWLTIDQMATLFQRNKSTISRHIRDAFECGELNPDSVVAFFATTAADGKNYNVSYYNLDMIISVGYRVHSLRGVQFRMWATRTLKEYLIKGFAMNDELLKRAGAAENLRRTGRQVWAASTVAFIGKCFGNRMGGPLPHVQLQPILGYRTRPLIPGRSGICHPG